MAIIKQDTNNIPEPQSPFEQLKEVDADGKEWRITGRFFDPLKMEDVIIMNEI